MRFSRDIFHSDDSYCFPDLASNLECSRLPIMEMFLLSYAHNIFLFNKLHDTPSYTHVGAE